MELDINFDTLSSFCVAFTPELLKLTLPSMYINFLLILYTDTIKLVTTTTMMQGC